MQEVPFQIGQQGRQLTSVQRALQVMRLFLETSGGLSVTEASRKLGIGKSTISRLMSTLASEGFVVIDRETRRYHVGPLAFEFGNRFVGANVARSVQPIISELAAKAGCTAQLGMLQGPNVLYLAVAQGMGRLRVVASPGDVRYAHSSAMGKVLLSALGADGIRARVDSMLDDEGLLPATGPNTIRRLEELNEELEAIRRRRYSTTNEEATSGVAAIGVLVPSPTDFALAISVAYPTNMYSPADHPSLLRHLTEAARAVGDGLAIKSDEAC